jgi:hypothetical protein
MSVSYGPSYFTKLNDGWDAEPNAPMPEVRLDGQGLALTFFLNAMIHEDVRDYDRGELFCPNCWRYRLGPTNDEGWYKGHCRFKCLAQDWGNFHEITGDIRESGPKD